MLFSMLEPSAHLLGYYQFTIVNFSCYFRVTVNKLGQPLRYLHMCSYFDYEVTCSKAVISVLVSTRYQSRFRDRCVVCRSLHMSTIGRDSTSSQETHIFQQHTIMAGDNGLPETYHLVRGANFGVWAYWMKNLLHKDGRFHYCLTTPSKIMSEEEEMARQGTNKIKRARGAHLSRASTSSLLWVDEHSHSSIQQNLSLIQTSNFIPSRSVTKKLYLRST